LQLWGVLHRERAIGTSTWKHSEGMVMRDVLVKDAVAYLAGRNPNEIARLQKLYPGAAELSMFAEHLKPLPALLKAQIDVAISALNEILSEWKIRERLLRAQSERANRWGFVGASLAILGSGTALTLILGDSGRVASSVAAAIGLVGGLVNVLERHLRQDLFGQKDGLPATFRLLIEDAAKASNIVRRLTPFVTASDDDDRAADISEILSEANALIVSMQSRLSSLPS